MIDIYSILCIYIYQLSAKFLSLNISDHHQNLSWNSRIRSRRRDRSWLAWFAAWRQRRTASHHGWRRPINANSMGKPWKKLWKMVDKVGNSRNIIETSWRMLDVEKIGKKWKISKHIGTCWKCWIIYEIHFIKMNIFENIDEWKPWEAVRFHHLNMGKNRKP